MLNIAHTNGIRFSAKKTHIFTTKVQCLGFELSHKHLQIDDARKDTMRNISPPHDVKSLERFIGLTNYLGRFIPKCAQHIRTFNTLRTSEVGSWDWTKEHQDSFDYILNSILHAPALAPFDPTQAHALETDGSQAGFGAVLYQYPTKRDCLNKNRTHETPVWFFSKAATGAQTKWPPYRTEIKALQLALDYGKHQLQYITFTVRGDHQNMKQYLRSKSLHDVDNWTCFWLLQISTFHFDFIYIPGAENVIADFLSRCRHTQQQEDMPESQLSRLSINLIRTDSQQEAILNALLHNDPLSHVHALFCDVIGNPLAVLLPAGHHISEYYKQDPYYGPIYTDILKPQPHRKRTAGITYFIKAQLLYSFDYTGTAKIIVPQKLIRKLILQSYRQTGYRGSPTVLATLKTTYHFQRMEYWITLICNAHTHNRNVTKRTHSYNGPSMPLPAFSAPMQCLAFDHVTGLPPVQHKQHIYDAVWVVHDMFSKYTYYIPSSTTHTSTDLVIAYMNRILPYDGLPHKFVSDNDSTYIHEMVQQLFKKLGIEHHTSVPHRPQGHGSAEISVRYLNEMIRSLHMSNQWLHLLPQFQLARNTAIHSVTGFTPQYLHRGRQLVLPTYTARLPQHPHGSTTHLQDWLTDFQTARAAIQIARHRMRWTSPNHRKFLRTGAHYPRVGALVLVHNINFGNKKGTNTYEPRYYGPYKVVHAGTTTVRVEACEGAHVTHGHQNTRPYWRIPLTTCIPYHPSDEHDSSPAPIPTGDAAGALHAASTAAQGLPCSTDATPGVITPETRAGLTVLEQAERQGKVVHLQNEPHIIEAVVGAPTIKGLVHYLLRTKEGHQFPVPRNQLHSVYLRNLKNVYNAKVRDAKRGNSVTLAPQHPGGT